MKIKKLILENFRSFKKKTEINIDNINCFIAVNDMGKSTILEALDIFINDNNGVIKLDKDDVSKKNGMDEIKIGVVFSEFEDAIDIDGGNITSLKSEYLVNKDGYLELFKIFKDGKCKSKGSGAKSAE